MHDSCLDRTHLFACLGDCSVHVARHPHALARDLLVLVASVKGADPATCALVCASLGVEAPAHRRFTTAGLLSDMEAGLLARVSTDASEFYACYACLSVAHERCHMRAPSLRIGGGAACSSHAAPQEPRLVCQWDRCFCVAARSRLACALVHTEGMVGLHTMPPMIVWRGVCACLCECARVWVRACLCVSMCVCVYRRSSAALVSVHVAPCSGRIVAGAFEARLEAGVLQRNASRHTSWRDIGRGGGCQRGGSRRLVGAIVAQGGVG